MAYGFAAVCAVFRYFISGGIGCTETMYGAAERARQGFPLPFCCPFAGPRLGGSGDPPAPRSPWQAGNRIGADELKPYAVDIRCKYVTVMHSAGGIVAGEAPAAPVEKHLTSITCRYELACVEPRHARFRAPHTAAWLRYQDVFRERKARRCAIRVPQGYDRLLQLYAKVSVALVVVIEFPFVAAG